MFVSVIVFSFGKLSCFFLLASFPIIAVFDSLHFICKSLYW